MAERMQQQTWAVKKTFWKRSASKHLADITVIQKSQAEYQGILLKLFLKIRTKYYTLIVMFSITEW